MIAGNIMARKKEDKISLNLKLPIPMVERVREDARKYKRPFSSQIELLIEKGLEVFDKEESLFQKAIEEDTKDDK